MDAGEYLWKIFLVNKKIIKHHTIEHIGLPAVGCHRHPSAGIAHPVGV